MCFIITFFRRSCMCWLLTYFLILVQKQSRIICNWQKLCSCLFSGPLQPFLPLPLIKPSWLLSIPLKSNLSQGYAVCLHFTDISCFVFFFKTLHYFVERKMLHIEGVFRSLTLRIRLNPLPQNDDF